MHNRKILMIGTLPPELGSRNYGGVARVVWNLAVSLQKEGVNVRIGGIGKYFEKFQLREGIEIFGIGFSVVILFKTVYILLVRRGWFSTCSLRHFIKLFYSVYFLLYLQKRINFDVIHVHHVINQIPLAARLLELKVKIITTIHSYSTLLANENFKEKKNINMQLQQADVVTHVSKHLRDTGINKGIKWPGKDSVIYNGISSVTHFEKSPGKNNEICFVGSVIKQKGIDRLMSSLEYLSDEKVSVSIVGVGGYTATIKKMIEERNLDVNLEGQLSHTETLKKMAGCRLLVNPSLSESFGLVYLEALMVGTPVIGYKSILSEFKDVLGSSGFLEKWLIEYDARKEDSYDLAIKIRKGLDTKKTSEYAKEHAFIWQEILNLFCWKKIAKQYMKLYDDV